MIRFTGLLLLCGGICLLGICAAQCLRRRERNLGELICGFEAVRREMKHTLAPLGDLLRLGAAQTAEGSVYGVFAEGAVCADNLNEWDFQTNWGHILESYRCSFAEEELSVLKQLGGVLGRYDGDEQLRALDVAIDRLRELYRLAGELSNRLGKVYTVLGMTSGAFAFLLLI